MEHLDRFSTPTPRLRVTRISHTNSTAWRNSFHVGSDTAGSIAKPMSQDDQSTSEDDFALEEAQGPNARLLSASLPPVDDSFHTSETSHRLKSILERFDKPNHPIESASIVSMPPTPSEPEFDSDLGPTATVRHSIRSIMEDALREPGDTPQRSRLLRRASFNASDNPKVDKTPRKSLSDEEREAQSKLVVSQRRNGISTLLSDHDGGSLQVITPEQGIINQRTPKLPSHFNLINRHRSHQELEPFRPISSESGLSSPERTKGLTLKSTKVLANFNFDNFASYMNSDAEEPSKLQFLIASNDQASADSHLRPISPTPSLFSSQISSPRQAFAETSSKAPLLPSPSDSNPINAKSRRLFNKDSNGKFEVSKCQETPQRSRLSPERKLEHELELERKNKNLPAHAIRSISPTYTMENQYSQRHEQSPQRLKSPDEERRYNKQRNRNSLTYGHQRFSQNSQLSHEHSHLHGTSMHSSRGRETPDHSSGTFRTPEGTVDEPSERLGFLSSSRREINIDHPPAQPQLDTPPASFSKASVFGISSIGSLGRSSHPKLFTSSVYDSSASPDLFAKGHRKTGLPELIKPSSPAQASIVSDSSTETFEPPHMSTPPSKSPKLPDVETSSLESSPLNSSISKATRQANSPRRHKVIQPDFTFPSSSSLQAQDLVSAKESLVDMKNELYAKVIPADDMHTPPHPEHFINSTYIKTPRPPGAFGTPYSQRNKTASGNGAPSTDTTHLKISPQSGPIAQDPSINDGMDTLATPAPPGAYRLTPGTAKRKGILKVVRFDETEINSASPEDSASHSPPSESKNRITDNLAGDLENDNFEETSTRRKGLRLVDEYGRVRKFTEDGTEVPLDRRVSQVDISTTQQTTLSGIESMSMTGLGAENTNEVITGRSEDGKLDLFTEPADKNAMAAHLTKSLGKMQADLAQEEETLMSSLPRDKILDNGRLNGLTTVSRTARLEREKLTHRLEAEREAEGKIQKRIFTGRSTSAHAHRGSWWVRRWRILLFGLILELCFLYLGYRIALVHSKQLWLGTHFDPFYPALYIHKLQPMHLNPAAMLPVNWSVFSVPNTFKSSQMGFTVKDLGKLVWDTALNWRAVSWDNWGILTETSIPQTWPS